MQAMKDIIILLLFCFLSLGVKAQSDSAHVSLPDSMHVTALALASDKGRVDIAHYQKWCAANIPVVKDSTGAILRDSAGNAKLLTPGTWRTYVVPSKATITYLYTAIGNYREGLVAKINAQLQAMLVEQLVPRRMDIVVELEAINQQNRAILKEIVQQDGINRIAQLQQ